ncbi:MAG: hypothetical protein D6739_09280 [Nitrospirae bacterium]|nr:MAG: hypothetical protein D6739_09280 [Nitrospirota bacterium]
MARPRKLGLEEVPLNTRFKRKPRSVDKKAIREKAKITIGYYDADHYGVTLKRGVTIVKKMKMPINKMSVEEAEKAVRGEVLKGMFDDALIDDYQRIMAERKQKKGKRGR